MMADTSEEMSKKLIDGRPKYKAHFFGTFEVDYSKELARVADIEPMIPVMTKARFESQRQMGKDFFAFRKIQYELLDDENYKIYGNMDSL
jgi:hypothetical protein